MTEIKPDNVSEAAYKVCSELQKNAEIEKQKMIFDADSTVISQVKIADVSVWASQTDKNAEPVEEKKDSLIPDSSIPYFQYDEETNAYLEQPEVKNELPRMEHENDFDKLILGFAEKYDVPPALIKAIMRLESGFDKNAANSSSSARGLMQMLTCARQSYGVKNAFDPKDIINGAAKLLQDLLARFNGDIKKAMLGYNQGAGGAKALLREGKTDTKAGYVEKAYAFYVEYQKSLANLNPFKSKKK